MRTYQLLSRMLGSLLLLVLLAVLVAGCDLPFLPGSTTSTSATACPSPVPFQATSGTIQSINGTTLLITATNGSTATAIYTSTTRFTRQARVTIAALQNGAFVFVAVTQNADNSYTANRISLSNAANAGSRPGGAFGGSGRRGGNGSACGRRGFRGGFGGQDLAGGNGNTRGISGTVSQLKGNTLTVTDVNQADFTVTLSSTTQIIQTSQAAATSLQVGMKVNLVGLRNAQGVLTARSVTILPLGSGK
jgi:uncharacterized protein DUF5666